MHVWLDGRILDDPGGPAIAVSDHGFTVGDGVFESVKVLDGRPFALTRHLERLEHSAAGLGLPEPDLARVREGVTAVLAAQHLPLGRLRVTYTGGPAPMGSGRSDHPPTLVVAAAPMDPMPATTKAATVPWRRNEHGPLAGLKTTSYAENVIALAAAARQGASEAIFANVAGNLCEGTGTNVFYVLDGELRTPTLASGCLAGVTRALVLEWYGAKEVDEPLDVLAEASEVFLVSTTRDVQALHALDSRVFEAPGPVARDALATWRRREAEDVDP